MKMFLVRYIIQVIVGKLLELQRNIKQLFAVNKNLVRSNDVWSNLWCVIERNVFFMARLYLLFFFYFTFSVVSAYTTILLPFV